MGEVLCITQRWSNTITQAYTKARTIAKANTYTGATVPFCHLSVQKPPRIRWSAQQATPALILKKPKGKSKDILGEQKLKGVSLK